jgi:predicted alpha/beta hydrolase
VKRSYYGAFASWLATRGFDVVTFDYRGIGDSARCPDGATMRQWGELDLAAAVTWASRELTSGGTGRCAIVGHSVGGQMIGLLPEPERVRAIVAVGAQSGDYRLWPLPSRLAMAALWYGVVPGVTHAVGYLPGALGIGENLPEGVALEWARWCRTPGYLVGGDGAARREGFARVRAPVLAFGIEDDPYAPPAAVDALLALYKNARVERRTVPRGRRRVGHFGFFRPRFHDTLWCDAAAFLQRTTRDTAFPD